MIIVFEGVDKSGKTTLSRRFQEITKLPLIKLEFDMDRKFWKNHIEVISQSQYLFTKCIDGHLNFILDRFIVSDSVYAKIFKRKIGDYFKPLEDFKDIIFIFCNPDLEVVLKRNRKEKVINELEIMKLHLEYKLAFETLKRESDYPILDLNTDVDLETSATKVLEFCKLRMPWNKH